MIASALLPQIVRSWRTRLTQDISLSWALINLAGQVLWILYGVLVHSLALTVMSCVTFTMALSVLYLKLRYGMKKRVKN